MKVIKIGENAKEYLLNIINDHQRDLKINQKQLPSAKMTMYKTR